MLIMLLGKVTASRLLQPEKAELPMLVMPLEIVTDVNLELPPKALSFMETTLSVRPL